MSSGIYSDLKMAWHLVRDGGVPVAPKQAQLIISDSCNQNCHFCAYRMDGYSSNQLFMGDSVPMKYGHNNPQRWIEKQKACEILLDLANLGVQGVQFTGGGEPTVNPHHEDIFEYALGVGLKCALVSNGVRWSDSLVAMLARFSWVRVSIDAGTAETYAKTRDTSPGTFDKVWGNVRRLAHAIRTPTPTDCVLGIGFTVTPDNYTEIQKAIEIASGSGAAYLRVSAMFSPDGAEPFRNIYPRIRDDIRNASALWERRDFRVHDLFGDRVEDLEQKAPDYPTCYYQHYNTYIGGDENVYRCCVLAYNEHGLLGSIKKRGYADFLRDPEVQAKLDNFDARSCERCQFNSKNRAMNYICGGKPPHSEFP